MRLTTSDNGRREVRFTLPQIGSIVGILLTLSPLAWWGGIEHQRLNGVVAIASQNDKDIDANRLLLVSIQQKLASIDNTLADMKDALKEIRKHENGKS